MDVFTDFKNNLIVEWPGNNRLSTIISVQFCLKSGSGTVKYIYLECELYLTANWKTNYGE